LVKNTNIEARPLIVESKGLKGRHIYIFVAGMQVKRSQLPSRRGFYGRDHKWTVTWKDVWEGRIEHF